MFPPSIFSQALLWNTFCDKAASRLLMASCFLPEVWESIKRFWGSTGSRCLPVGEPSSFSKITPCKAASGPFPAFPHPELESSCSDLSRLWSGQAEEKSLVCDLYHGNDRSYGGPSLGNAQHKPLLQLLNRTGSCIRTHCRSAARDSEDGSAHHLTGRMLPLHWAAQALEVRPVQGRALPS